MSLEYEYEDDDVILDDFVIMDDIVAEAHSETERSGTERSGTERSGTGRSETGRSGTGRSGTGRSEEDGIWAIVTDLNKLRKYWVEILSALMLLLAAWIFGLPLLEYYFRLGKRFIYLLSFFIPVLALWGFNRVNKDRVARKYNQTRFDNSSSSGIGAKGRNVSGHMKKYVAANQQWHCAHCGALLEASYEIDHILPLYRGGSNTIENLQALCPNCHGSKTIRDAIIG